MRKFLPLLLTAACTESPDLPEIPVDQEAACGVTLMDNIRAAYETEIEAIASHEGIYPLVRIEMERDDLDTPEQVDPLVPGEIDALGVDSYDSTQNDFVTSYISSTDGYSYFFDTPAGTACADNTFAYNFNQEGYPEDTILVTGKCTWTGFDEENGIGTCDGSVYRSCPYVENQRGNYDCEAISGFFDAPARVAAIDTSK